MDGRIVGSREGFHADVTFGTVRRAPTMAEPNNDTDFSNPIRPQPTIEQGCRSARNPLGSQNGGMITIGAGVAEVLKDAGASPIFFNQCGAADTSSSCLAHWGPDGNPTGTLAGLTRFSCR